MFFKASDDELMVRLATGDHAAFRSLFDRHGSRLLGYCRRFMGDSARGEDMAQDVWMKIVRSAPTYKPENKFSAFLLTTARNTCLSEMRKQSSKLEFGDSDIDAKAEVVLDTKSVEDQMNLEEIKRKIDELPQAQRVVLTLHMAEDLSYEEIAKELELTVPAVKSLLFRARQTLQKTVRAST